MRRFILSLALILTALVRPAFADDPKPYTRVAEDEKTGVLTLELASRTFAKPDGTGPKVTLVSAVHIADLAFYTAMQKQLDATDVVLFEGVKPGGVDAIAANLDDAAKAKATHAREQFLLAVVAQFRDREGRFPKDFTDLVESAGKRAKGLIAASLTDAWGSPLTLTIQRVGDDDHPTFRPKERPVVSSPGPDKLTGEGHDADDVREEGLYVFTNTKATKDDGGIQLQLAKALGLEFQLEHMDSSKANWRNSDMNVDEMQTRMTAAGGDASGLLKMLDGSGFMGKLAGFMLNMVGKSPQLSATMKLMMVEMLSAPDLLGGMGGAGGANLAALMKVIVVERNIVVLDDLKRVIEKEPGVKTVSIFYGAGHFFDMEKRLVTDMGFEPVGDTWSPAISVDPKVAGYTPEQSRRMRESIRTMIKNQAGK
ncbi:MAG: hypothetical protein AABZ53_14415 [Planctomycetota bacterium]